jgi:hypothetical protein
MTVICVCRSGSIPGRLGFAADVAPPGLRLAARIRGLLAVASGAARALLEERHGGPAGDDDPPGPPETGSTPDSIWDDPMLWTMMMHFG